jgi:rfaE bifunctional protein kinase chain/domain
MKTEKEKLLKNVDRLKGHKILIVGDVGLDEYVIGNVRRISPEAPVPVLEVSQEDKRLGLSSNVAANVAALGGEAWLVGVIGKDETAESFKKELQRARCTSEYMIVDSQRPTTRKLRVMAGQHHIVRVDFEKKKYLEPATEARLFEQVEKLMPLCDAVILEDYAKGVLSLNLIQKIIAEAKKLSKPVTLDPNSTTPIKNYVGVDYLTPNTQEAMALSGLNLDDLRSPSESLEEVGESLLKQIGSSAVIITRGKEGMSLFKNSGAPVHIPTYARAVYDVTGAGDTVIATFTLALTAGLTLEEACVLSNYAAGVVVGKIGCVSTSPEELKSYILER